jgi:hypothetical protein
LIEWRLYLAKLNRYDSIGNVFPHLKLDYVESLLPNTR